MSEFEDLEGLRDFELIGAGGYSRVYRARQEHLDREVAVKILLDPTTNADSAAQFEKECAVLAAVGKHPNIVAVFSAGTAVLQGAVTRYIVMALHEGGTLNDQVRLRSLTPAMVISIGVRLSETLAWAHQTGVVHRDVKPSNVLIADDGEPILTDFGVASARGIGLPTATILDQGVSIAFAAPELLRGERADARCDVYSLSATMFALLAGHPPFLADEGSIAELTELLTAEGPPKLGRARCPAPLASVIERAMSHDPEDRPATAEQFADELRGAAAELGVIISERLVVPRPVVPKVRPRRTQVRVAGAVAALGLVAFFAGLLLGRDGDNASRSSLGAFDETEFCRARGEYIASMDPVVSQLFTNFVNAPATSDIATRVQLLQDDGLSDLTNGFLVYTRRLAPARYGDGVPVASDLALVLLHQPNILTRMASLRIMEAALNRRPTSGPGYDRVLSDWWNAWWQFDETEPNVLLAEAALDRLERRAVELCGDRIVRVGATVNTPTEARELLSEQSGVSPR